MSTIRIWGQTPKLRTIADNRFITVVGGQDGYVIGGDNHVLDELYGKGPFVVEVDDNENGRWHKFTAAGTKIKVLRWGSPSEYTVTEVTLPD